LPASQQPQIQRGATVDNEPPIITGNGSLTINDDASGVADVAALNAGGSNRDKVTQTVASVSVADDDTTTIDLTALTNESALVAPNKSAFLVSGTLDSATQTFTVTVTDNAGNTDTVASDPISVDNQAPTVSFEHISVTGATGAGGVFSVGG